MEEITVNFIHPTSGREIQMTLDETTTCQQVIAKMLSEGFIPYHLEGYGLAIKGGGEIGYNQSLADAGVKNGATVRIIPVITCPGYNSIFLHCSPRRWASTCPAVINNTPEELVEVLVNYKHLPNNDYELAAMLPEGMPISAFSIFEGCEMRALEKKESYHKIQVEVIKREVSAESDSCMDVIFKHPIHAREMVIKIPKSITAKQAIEGLQMEGFMGDSSYGYTLVVQESGYPIGSDELLTDAGVTNGTNILVIPTVLKPSEHRSKERLLVTQRC